MARAAAIVAASVIGTPDTHDPRLGDLLDLARRASDGLTDHEVEPVRAERERFHA